MRSQFAFVWPLFALWGLATLALAGPGSSGDGSALHLFEDPQTIGGLPWYAGLASELRFVLWSASSVLGIFGGWVARHTGRPSAARFLTAGGLVSLLLLVDDMLLFHARALPSLFGGAAIASLVILIPVLAWLRTYRHEVRRTRWMILASAIVLFVPFEIAAASDGVLPEPERGATLLVAILWTAWFGLTTRDIVASTIRSAMGSGLSAGALEQRDDPSRDAGLVG